jgi:DNA-binding transcriptional LysR family regulator
VVTINKSFEYFLTAAEELNFTKASKKHYISQQAFSQHIKKLEEDYKTVLFERTPYVRLTDEGRVFLEYVKAQKILDESLKKRLYEMGKGKRGKFSFGINASRSRIVLPEILKEYSENFPNVDISVYLNDTKDMEEMVIDGKLDLFMGINTKRKEELDIKSICFDSVYMVMSVATIEKIFGDESKAFIENSKDGVEMN